MTYLVAFGSGGGFNEYDFRDQISRFARLALTSILRVRFITSGLLE
jgi:hypothetical protein